MQVKTAQSVSQLTAPLLDMEEALRPIALSATWDPSKHSKAPKASPKASPSAAVDAPELADADAQKLAAADAPKAAAVDAPKLASAGAPKPAAVDAPKPAATSAEKGRPSASSALRPPARWVDPDLLQRGWPFSVLTSLLPALSAAFFGIDYMVGGGVTLPNVCSVHCWSHLSEEIHGIASKRLHPCGVDW